MESAAGDAQEFEGGKEAMGSGGFRTEPLGGDGGDGCVWGCSVCTYDNERDCTICEMCGSPKPVRPAAAASCLTAAVERNNLQPGERQPAATTAAACSGASSPGGLVESARLVVEGFPSLPAGDKQGDRETEEKREATGTTLQHSPSRHKKQQQQQQWQQTDPQQQCSPEPEHKPEPDAVVPPRVVRKERLRARYQLCGVLHHLGQNALAGHYVTDVREGVAAAAAATATDRRAAGPKEKTAAAAKDDDVIVVGGDCGTAGAGGVGADENDAAGGDEAGRRRRWKRHDDSLVVPVSEATALDGAARRTCYICFYSLVVE